MKYCCICETSEQETKIIKRGDSFYCRKHYLQMYKYGITRRSRLENNVYIINDKENYAEIELYNNYGTLTGKAIIDIDDIEKCKNIKWYLKRSKNTNYIYGNFKSKKIILHRYIINCDDNNVVVDHINHNGLDNRRSNLRIATHKENIRNSSKDTIIGVIYDKNRNKWKASIMIDGKNLFLGRYENKEDAIIARLKAEKEYFKEFAPQQFLMKKYNI